MIRSLRRLWNVIGLAIRRVLGRTRIAPHRVLLTVLGVSVAIGLMIAVTSISLGLASESVVTGEEIDYWIVPEEANVQSIAISSGGLQLGDVHRTSSQLTQDQRVRYATPVLLELMPIRDTVTGDRAYVLAVGVIPEDDHDILGLSMDALHSGDPYYANGTYNGSWTGEAIVNTATAKLANVTTGSTITLAGTNANRSFRATAIQEGDTTTPTGTIPLMVVHLAELQRMTDAVDGDQADQILVSTNDRSVRIALESRYPRTTVVTQTGLSTQQLSTSNLPLAVALAAFLASVIVGVLFVTTLMALEVNADREQLGVLVAIGYSSRTRSVLIATETIIISLIGGVLGIGVGLVGIALTNFIGASLFDISDIATFDPRLIGYAFVVTLVIGTLGAIYPVFVERRMTPLEVLSR